MPSKQKKNSMLEEKELMKAHGEKLFEVVKRVASVSEYASHSYSLRQILAEHDIDLPYCLNLDVIVQYLEDQVENFTLLWANSPIEALGMLPNDSSNGKLLLIKFQQTFPSTYFELIRKNLSSISQSLDNYIVSCSEKRREPGYESSKPITSFPPLTYKSKRQNIEDVDEYVASDSMSDQKKKKKKNKKKRNNNEKSILPDFSSRTQLLLTLAHQYKIEPHEILSNKDECIENGKAAMVAGNLHKGANSVAISILISEQKEQLLSTLEQTLPPAHFDLVRKKMTHIEQELKAGFNHTISELSKSVEIEIPDEADSNSNQKKKRKKIERPEHISEDFWQLFYDLGRHVSDFVLDALAVYESSNFADWNKERVKNIESSLDKKNEVKKRYRRNLVCEYVLVERMKDEDFFCCDLCQMVLFNYKHALIHFTSNEHCKKETDLVKNSGVDCFRRVLDLFTDLPKKLLENDETTERNRQKKNGRIDYKLYDNVLDLRETPFRPNKFFLNHYISDYMNLTESLSVFSFDPESGKKILNPSLAAKAVIKRVKSDVGRKAIAELIEHLGQAPTICLSCGMKTGDRDGFFAHNLSYYHYLKVFELKAVETGVNRNFNPLVVLLTIVNILKKDLVV